MIDVLISAIRIFEQLLALLVIVKVIISYFMSPYNKFRMTVDRLVEPLLAPIRRVLPTIGMFDFSPLVLIILVQLIAGLLINILLSVR
ncbi:MAG: YggT family protein [Anaerolineales bacterium]|jgi:YggT family protein|nr:YggT family protein [Anaerolineales bacterium]